jgi:hypothetical protein
VEYVIFLDDEMWVGPVADEVQAFLRGTVLPAQRQLADDMYTGGVLGILSTGARAAYVLVDGAVLWCVEWEPGLLVVRFAADGSLGWSQHRSPVPGFGGRPVTAGEEESWDEALGSVLYALVFDAWDAQFDDAHVEREFTRATEAHDASWDAAMAHSEALSDKVEESFADDAAAEAWLATCEQSALWRGVAPGGR